MNGKLKIDLDIEDVDLNAVENVVSNMAAWVRDEYNSMRKTAINVYLFLCKYNLGYVDNYTHEFLSHDREVVFCRVYS